LSFFRRLLFYWRREEFERELEEEMRLHRELKREEYLASGMTPSDARRVADREFGRTSRLMEDSRETWSFALLDSLAQDVRLGLRALRMRPGFTAVGLVSLALGIGANTAVFTLVNQAFLRRLPVAAPEELISLQNDTSRSMFPAFSYPNYEDYRDRNDAFTGLIAYRFAPLSVSHDGRAERVWGYLVSGNYFEILGIEPALGRLLSKGDDVLPGGHPVAVLSHRSWVSRFGGTPSIIGTDVGINGRSYTIVGVAAPGFDGTELIAEPEVFLPIAMQAVIDRRYDSLDDRSLEIFYVQGRLRPGIGRARAQASLDSIALELEREHPRINQGKKVSLSPAGLMSGRMRSGLLGFSGLLMAVVGFALLLACTNLANLLLARAAERRREIGMSLALGAGRMRLVRRLLVECVVLSAAGGMLGFLLALWLVRLVALYRPSFDFPLAWDLEVDWRVAFFTFFVSLAAGLLFGLLPALRITRVGPRAALQEEPSEKWALRWSRGGALVVFQVALSLLLLVGSGLAGRGLKQAQAVSLGFDPARAAEVSFDLGLQGYEEARGREIQKELLARVRTLPGVAAAAVANFVPVDLHFSRTRLFIEGAPVPERVSEAPITFVSRVSPGYFPAMTTRVVAGRDFTETDEESSTRVALVSEALANRFWPGEDPLGKRLSLGSPDAPRVEVVGVAEDGKYASLNEEPQPFVYLPIRQAYSGSTTIVVRAASDPGLLLPSIQAEIQRLDPAIAVYGARVLAERLALPLFPARIAAALFGVFGVLSLSLAAVGIYGVISQMVSRRRREIGIRVALGARRKDVLTLAMSAGLIPTLVGILAGTGAALLLTRWMTSLLFGVSPKDPWTFTSTAAVLLAVAALACFIPARRAAKAAPMASLRTE
jgi:predicted permease